MQILIDRLSPRRPPFPVVKALWGFLILCLCAWFVDYNYRTEPDPMTFSGFVAIIVGLTYSVFLDRSQLSVIDRWHRFCIFDITPPDMRGIQVRLFRTELIATPIVTCMVVFSTIVGYSSTQMNFDAEFMCASVVCATLVGLRLSRLVTHGMMGWTLKAKNVRFHLMIEHPDRAGGTAQVGNFYLLQASVLAVPALWLIFWVFEIRSFTGYDQWTSHFYTLVLIVMLVFAVAFWLPMLAFRCFMSDRWHSHVWPEIARGRNELLKLLAAEIQGSADRARRRELTSYVQALNNIPAWPVSPATVGGFATVFLTPLVATCANYVIGRF